MNGEEIMWLILDYNESYSIEAWGAVNQALKESILESRM
jgi:hypothetical protein